MSSQAIGIDLGGINSYAAVYLNGKVEIIPNDLGNRKTPSYVAFNDKEILIGETAKNQIKRNPKNTIFNIERLIGRKFEDRELQENLKYWPFKIIKDVNSDKPQIQITYKNEEKKYYPENIISMILQNLKKNASEFLGKEVKDAIISVPNHFNIIQIGEIIDAAKDSGLNILKVLHSSTAAAFTYSFEKGIKDKRNIFIFDLGAGTLNLSILTVEDGLFEERSINYNRHLGGEDFNYKLFDYCAKEFRKKTGIDIKKNSKAISRLYNACENAKIALSSSKETSIDLEYLIDNEDFNITISRDKFEDLCFELFKSMIHPIENAIKDAKISKSQIDDIILVGGSSRIQRIQKMLKEFFNGRELNKGLNPEEAIAYGLAIQASILTKVKDVKIEEWTLLDIYPFSLGIETIGGVSDVVIPRNSLIPIKKSKFYSNYEDNQTFISVKIYEGERQLTKDNAILGILYLDDIPPMPKGQLQIEITFELYSNTKLTVTVIEKSTGKKNQIIISKETIKSARKVNNKRYGPLVDINDLNDINTNMNSSNMNNSENMANNPNTKDNKEKESQNVF